MQSKSLLFFLFLFQACFRDYSTAIPETEPSLFREWVDTRSGTGGFWWASGHTSPAAQVPMGLVRVGPDTATFSKITSSSGYHYNDLELLGFSHTRLSGTGAYEGGLLRVKPLVDVLDFEKARSKKLFFSHSRETANPGFYSVHLKNVPVEVELTAGYRSAFHKYRLTQKGALVLWIDLNSHIWGQGDSNQITVSVVDSQTLTIAQRHQDAFSARVTDGLPFYSYLNFSEVPQEIKIWNSLGESKNIEEITFPSDDPLWLSVAFETFEGDYEIFLRMGLSTVDAQGAQQNFISEVNGKNFETILSEAQQNWETILSTVQVTSSDNIQKKMLYENLYRSFVMPTCYSDVDGRYRNMNGEIQNINPAISPGGAGCFWGDLSLWDTFRTQNALITLLKPQTQTTIVASLLESYSRSGRLPRWTLGAHHVDSMIGFPSVMVISETLQKGISSFDLGLGSDAILKSLEFTSGQAVKGRECLEEYLNVGYCTTNNQQSVSINLEYIYSFYSGALFFDYLADNFSSLGASLGSAVTVETLNEHKNSFKEKSLGGLKLWSEQDVAFVPKNSEGTVIENLSLTDTDYLGLYESSRHLREGSLSQWRWYPAILGEDYFKLFGSENNFTATLDTFMSQAAQASGAVFPGSGFWQGNEPNILAPFLFSLQAHPEKTAEWSRWVLDTKYKMGAQALDGDDDAGTLSSYFVLSSMGFFPLAGSSLYIVGTPRFEEMRISINDAQASLIVRAPGVSSTKKYVQSVAINGEKLENPYFEHSLIKNGGEIVFELMDTPQAWGNIWPGYSL
jgi:predicted alpha-1,2-mannosidase